VRRRVPVVHQVSTSDCGIACLQMIAAHFAVRPPDATASDVGRDGASLAHLARSARQCGLDCRAVAAQELRQLRDRLPVIAYWRFDHYVVVEAIGARHVDIIDPATGRRRIDFDEVDQCFTGAALTFARGGAPTGSHARPSQVRLYLSKVLQAAPWRRLVATLTLLTLLLQLLGLGIPLLTAALLDRVVGLGAAAALARIALCGGLVVFCTWAAQVLRGMLTARLYASLDAGAMESLFEHLLALPFRFFQQRPTGDLMQRLASHTIIRDAFTTRTLSALLDVVFAAAYAVVLAVAAPSFAVVALTAGALSLLLVLASTRQLEEVTQEHITAQSGAQNYAAEALMGIATLKAIGAESRVFGRWSALVGRQLSASARREQHVALVEATLQALRLAASVAILWLGGHAVAQGHLSIGAFVAFSGIALSTVMPFSSIAQTIQQLLLVRAHVTRVADILEQPAEAGAGGRCIDVRGAVELRDVSFHYHADGPAVLHDISLTIGAGQKVAIVGGTGSGKSTLGMLLLGLHRPSGGEVFVDGHALGDLDLQHLRRQCGAVLQEPTLVSGTLRENIALAGHVGLDEITSAARIASIADEIDAMLMAYDTRVGSGGSGLSGGQRQRIALARAVAARPRILLLDEATSQLDVITEERVDRNLDALACTRIVIAHRLSTVRNADSIFVLDRGRIVEHGTHHELLCRRGRYHELVEAQLSTAPEVAAAAEGAVR